MYRLLNVSKTFKDKENIVNAVNNVSLTIEKGSIHGIIGFSGAGKSTLVRCLNLLEVPDSGKVIFNGKDLMTLKGKELRKSPLEIAGVSKKEAVVKAKKLLEMVGIADKAKSYPSKLSGGQKQRVAIARALATDPDVLLCDEATSALDPITTTSILELLKSINKELGVTIVVITHEMKVVKQICDTVSVMSDGNIVEQGKVKDIFMNPHSDITKKLVINNLECNAEDNRKYLRIVFEGQSAFEPVISSLTLECNEMVNILGANTENIGGRAYGQMLIELPENKESVQKIKNYLDKKQITFEEGGENNDTAND